MLCLAIRKFRAKTADRPNSAAAVVLLVLAGAYAEAAHKRHRERSASPFLAAFSWSIYYGNLSAPIRLHTNKNKQNINGEHKRLIARIASQVRRAQCACAPLLRLVGAKLVANEKEHTSFRALQVSLFDSVDSRETRC